MFLKQCEVESRVEFFKGDIQETIKSHKTIKKWAYILHDKDDTAPHYHIYLNFDRSSVDTKNVAEWFGLQESQVNKVRGRMTDMLLYLTHGNESQKNKHQYSPSEVVSNFDFEAEIKNAQVIGDFTTYSYAQQLEYVHSLSPAEQVSVGRRLRQLWEIHCQWLSLQSDRHMEVMFVCGKGGTGKTYYARKLMDNLKYDYCISSSSNDPFQDYLGQKGMILDDLRDKAFELEDLLKILDNNTSSSVKSRFSNKVFNGELMIITTSVPLRYWYPDYKSGRYDTLEQLYRRISCYVEVTMDEITVYHEIDKYGFPTGFGTVYKNDLHEKVDKQKKKTNFNDVFGKICEPQRVFGGEQTKMDLK